MIKGYHFFPAVFFALSVIGCASDQTTDLLKQDITNLKNQINDIQKTNTNTETKLSGIEDRLDRFEEKTKDLENQVFNLSAKLEEGPEIELPAEIEGKEPSSSVEIKEMPSLQKEGTLMLEKPPSEKTQDMVTEKRNEDELKNLASLSPEELYKKAYDHFIFGEYDKAVNIFKIFLDNNPKSNLADNSQYWIGECYYAKREYNVALSEFQKVVERYPNGNKTPDAMLKIGYVYYELGDKKSALKELNNVVKKFPKKGVAKVAKEKIRDIEKGK
jgi:tol-pal system protein YbgF